MTTDREPTVFMHDSGITQGNARGTPCLVVLYGASIGRRHLLDKPEIILGRSISAAIQVDQESASREHARVVVQDGICRVTDLSSTNGTWVNELRVGDIELRDGDLMRVGQTIFKYLTGENLETKYHEEIHRLTTIDGLTGAVNKRYFLEALERELGRAFRYARSLSLAMFDIDHFKAVNDRHGHLAGDYVLRELGRLVAKQVRPVDVFARYGGEEFSLVLPETDRKGSTAACEKLRRVVREHNFLFNHVPLSITMSFGVATIHPSGPDATGDTASVPNLISQADAKLYEAKQCGRDRVCA